VLSEELKVWRKTYDLSQDELAEALGVHRLTVSKWERGVHQIPTSLPLTLESVARGRRKRPRRVASSEAD
jgi:transcriptional regulator with XRE-family HTH domain